MKYALIIVACSMLAASCKSVNKATSVNKQSVDSSNVYKSDSTRVVKKDSTVTEVSKDSISAVIVEKKDVEEVTTESYDTSGKIVTKVTRKRDQGITTVRVEISGDHSRITDQSVSDSADVDKSGEVTVKKDSTQKTNEKKVKKTSLVADIIVWVVIIGAVGLFILFLYRKGKKKAAKIASEVIEKI